MATGLKINKGGYSLSTEATCYAIHPGFVISKKDKDRHYIGYNRLIALYRLDPKRCFHGERPESFLGRHDKDVKHIYPRSDGNYPIFA